MGRTSPSIRLPWRGRAYIAFVVPSGCRAYLLALYDSAGHIFASTTTLPRAG